MSDKQQEEKLKAQSTAPRVTLDRLGEVVVDEDYYNFPGTTVTVCALTLENGFVVIGESAAASPLNFDPQIGKDIAKENASQKIWALEGYLLKQRLFEA